MKRSVYLLLFTIFLAAYSNTAEAQFWKKIFKKEAPRKKPAPKKPVVKKDKPAPKPVKKREISYPVSQMKKRYRVDVLVPLYLGEMVQNDKVTFKGKLPAKALPGMEFYEGVKLAADTLTTFGFDIDVHIHDIQDPNNAPALLIKTKGLDSTNLIIGAVQSQQIPIWASFAKERHVNFISSLSPSDAEVRDNPYFTLLQPTLQTHCEQIMEMVKQKHRGVKPLLLYRTSVAVDQSAYNYLTASASGTNVKQLLVNEMPLRHQLRPLLDSTGINVIVAGIIDNTYAENLLKQLSSLFPQFKFEIYGMPSWTTIGSLRKVNTYPNMAVNVTTPFHYDAITPARQQLEASYKRAYGINKPGDMVYRGYETMLWYAFLLHRYGTIFNDKTANNVTAPFTKFDIRPKWSKDNDLLYQENQHVYLYRYQDGSFSISQ